MGLHPEPTACVRDAGKKKTRCVNCPPQARSKKPRSRAQLFGRFCALGERVVPRFTYSWKFGAGFCPAAGNRSQVFSLFGKTGVRRGPTPGRNRVYARLKYSHKPGARLAHRRCTRRSRATCSPQVQEPCVGLHPEPTACVRDAGKKKTRCASCPAQPRGRVRLGEKRGRANRFAGGRRTTGCIAGDKAACADSPAPGRRVRELPAAGGL